MSWDAYVTNLEAKCTYGALVGRAGGIWAESKTKDKFPVTDQDILKVANQVISQDSNIYGTGVSLPGMQFTVLRMEPEILICKGKGDRKEETLCIAISSQAVIVGYNSNPDIKPPEVRKLVEEMKDYLKNQNY